jgi:hypothetical protein
MSADYACENCTTKWFPWGFPAVLRSRLHPAEMRMGWQSTPEGLSRGMFLRHTLNSAEPPECETTGNYHMSFRRPIGRRPWNLPVDAGSTGGSELT